MVKVTVDAGEDKIEYYVTEADARVIANIAEMLAKFSVERPGANK